MPSPFLKSVPKGKETRAKESEKRKFRERVKQLCPTLSDEQAELIIPSAKSEELRLCKLGKHDALYRVGQEGQPMFIEMDGEGVHEGKPQLIPSCYSLHIAPQLLRVVTVYPGVDKRVCQGADLFLPGVVRPDDMETEALQLGVEWPSLVFGEPFQKGDLCCLVTQGGWAPFAVGYFALPSSDLPTSGMQGTGVMVIHHLFDALWDSGTGLMPSLEPPASAVEAVEAYAIAQEENMERARVQEALRAEKQARLDRANRLTELVQRKRKVEKVLRQITEMKAASAVSGKVFDVDQQAKVDKEGELMEEMKSMEEETLKLSMLEQQQQQQAGPEGAGARVEVGGGGDAGVRVGREESGADDWEDLAADQTQESTSSSRSRSDSPALRVEAVQLHDADAVGAVLVSKMEARSVEGGEREASPGSTAADAAAAAVGADTAGGASGGAGYEKDEDRGEVEGCDDKEEQEEQGVEGEEEAKGEEEGQNEEEQEEDAGESTEERQARLDETFMHAAFTVLLEEALPCLSNVVFGKASKRAGGVGIKDTRWKKASNFLEDFQEQGAIVTREVKVGVVEVSSFHRDAVPPFQLVTEPPEGGAGQAQGLLYARGKSKALVKKKGGVVQVSMRKVRGKNVTFIDGLESWGLSKDDMQDVAKDFRKRFSASASVSERGGTQGGRSDVRGKLWSLQVQGKYAEQVGAALREKGVTKVDVSTKGLNKADRAANV